MINTLRRAAALWASMAIILFAAATPAHSQAPTDAQRSAIRSQCRVGLRGPLRQHPAGRQGVAAMLAAKHVEPLIRLPGGGACRRSAGDAESGVRTSERRPSPPQPPQQPSLTPRPRLRQRPPKRLPLQSRRQAPGQKAQQRAGGSDTKRVPQRLSAKLRRRADRGRRGIELSGKEQGEPLGQLSESRQCGRRRCRRMRRLALRLPVRGANPAAAPSAPRWCCGRCGPAR